MHRLAVVFILVVASSAYAMEHQMRISEVLRSKGGDTTIQYVELIDLNPAGESFPSPPGPYKLEVFDAAGVSLGTTALTITPTPAHGEYIATAAADTAFGTTRQDTLGTPLPLDGQVCFEGNAGTKYGCLAWGCITMFVQVGEPRAPTPPDNMSVQRQSDGTYQVGTPTPNAANVAGSTIRACPTDPIDTVADDVPPDAPRGDAGNGNTGGGGGCCQTSSHDAPGAIVLALATLLALRRRRA